MNDNRQDRRSGGTIRVGTATSIWGGAGGGVIALDTDDLVAVPLSQITRQTGGRWITNANALEKVVAEVVEQNTVAYALAYESPVSRTVGAHTIDVRVRRPGTRVYARQGYTVTAASPASTAASSLLRDTLSGSAPQGTLPMQVYVAPQFAIGNQGRAVVTIRLDEGRMARQSIDVALTTFDEQARPANQQALRLAPAAPGQPWELTTEVRLTRGRHQLRVAGVTADASRTGLVITPVEIIEPGRDLVMTPPVLLDTTAGQVHPTAMRQFTPGDPLGLQVEVGGRAVLQQAVDVRLSLVDAAGVSLRSTDAVLDPAGKPDRRRATGILTTDGLPPGAYALLVDATERDQDRAVRHAVPIALTASSAPSAARPAAASTAPVSISHSTVAQGPLSSHPGAGTFVIRTEAEWAAFWKHLPTRQAAPPIDFDRVTLVAIVTSPGTQGARPVVTGVERSGGETVIQWRLEAASGSPASAADHSRPFVVIGVVTHLDVVHFRQVP